MDLIEKLLEDVVKFFMQAFISVYLLYCQPICTHLARSWLACKQSLQSIYFAEIQRLAFSTRKTFFLRETANACACVRSTGVPEYRSTKVVHTFFNLPRYILLLFYERNELRYNITFHHTLRLERPPLLFLLEASENSLDSLHS